MARRFLVLALLLGALPLLGGCAWFQSAMGWDRARPEDRKTASDLDACKAQARAVNQRDARISQDIGGGAMFNDTTRSAYTDQTLTRNMNSFAAQGRYTRIVDDCMAGQGYGAPAPAAKPAGSGTAPPPGAAPSAAPSP